jgi:hypothetical protein
MRDNDPFLREFIISSKGLQVQEAYAALQGMSTGLPTHRQHSAHESAGPSPAPKATKKTLKRLESPKRRSRKPGGRK